MCDFAFVSVLINVLVSTEQRANLSQARSNAALRRPEWDRLGLADLARAESVEGCEKEGAAFFFRSASMARFLVIVSSQLETEPRPASKEPAFRHARMSASCAMSSAWVESPNTLRASP